MENKQIDIEFTKTALLAEYERRCNQIVDIEKGGTQVVSFLLPAAALVVSLATIKWDGVLTQEFLQLFHMLVAAGCAIINVFLLLSCKHLIDELRMALYVKHLEDEINEISGKNILQWESLVTSKYTRKAPSNWCLFILEVIVFIGMIIASLFVQAQCFLWFRVFILIIIGLEACIGIMLFVEFVVFQKKIGNLFTRKSEETVSGHS